MRVAAIRRPPRPVAARTGPARSSSRPMARFGRAHRAAQFGQVAGKPWPDAARAGRFRPSQHRCGPKPVPGSAPVPRPVRRWTVRRYPPISVRIHGRGGRARRSTGRSRGTRSQYRPRGRSQCRPGPRAHCPERNRQCSRRGRRACPVGYQDGWRSGRAAIRTRGGRGGTAQRPS